MFRVIPLNLLVHSSVHTESRGMWGLHPIVRLALRAILTSNTDRENHARRRNITGIKNSVRF